jgi:RimJ/RimL family protein N-acetyltransferase
MTNPPPWPLAVPLEGPRLLLEPLRVAHAEEAVAFLGDARLHTYIGGEPPSRGELEERYRRQSAGHSPDGSQGWLNWMVRARAGGLLVGTVQATLTRPRPGLLQAELAWVVGHDFQGHGYAKESAEVMAHWLRDQGVSAFAAHIHPHHHASVAVAKTLGLRPTGTLHEGEQLWTDAVPHAPATGGTPPSEAS